MRVVASAIDKIDMIGKILAEYRIVEALGGREGTEVYRAVGYRNRRQVAIKLFPPELSDDKTKLQKLLDNLREISRLDRPGFPRLIGSGLNGGRAYIIMPFMTGGSLQDRLEMGQITQSDALGLLEVIADALDTIHRLHSFHGHLSLSEIMFDETGQPRMIGLGHLSLLPTRWDSSRDGAQSEYTAPEVRGGAMPTPASDQYSLAVIAFELLSGQRAREVIEAVDGGSSEQDASDPHRPLPPQVAEVFERGLADDPSQRFASVADMVRALHEAIETQDASSRGFRPAHGHGQGGQRILRSLFLGLAGLAFIGLGCFALTLPAMAAARWMNLDLGPITDILPNRLTPPTGADEPDRASNHHPEMLGSLPTASAPVPSELPTPTAAVSGVHAAKPIEASVASIAGPADQAARTSSAADAVTSVQSSAGIVQSGNSSRGWPSTTIATP